MMLLPLTFFVLVGVPGQKIPEVAPAHYYGWPFVHYDRVCSSPAAQTRTTVTRPTPELAADEVLETVFSTGVFLADNDRDRGESPHLRSAKIGSAGQFWSDPGRWTHFGDGFVVGKIRWPGLILNLTIRLLIF